MIKLTKTYINIVMTNPFAKELKLENNFKYIFKKRIEKNYGHMFMCIFNKK